jgi:transposase
MQHLSAEAKHHILLEYAPRSTTHSFAALARRHAVRGGARTLQRWHSRWNRTPHSLQEGERAGRPHALSRAQVSRHVRAPILAANRAHRSVRYPQLLDSVREKTGTQVSLRTLRRYGQEMGATMKRGKKRTAEERECMHAHRGEGARVCVLHTTHSRTRLECA